jgi:hypothetical protein
MTLPQPPCSHALPSNIADKCRYRYPCGFGGYKRRAELRVSAVIRFEVADIANLDHEHHLRLITAMIASGKFVQKCLTSHLVGASGNIITPSSSMVAPLILIMMVSILTQRKIIE